MALVGAGGAGDADVPVDVVPLDAGFAEPKFLAEGVHAGHALLQVSAGPDVAEAGHAAMLRFIRTGRNRKKTPVQGAEQMGGFSRGSSRSYAGLEDVGPGRPAGSAVVTALRSLIPSCTPGGRPGSLPAMFQVSSRPWW